jgi:hypothetical protein
MSEGPVSPGDPDWNAWATLASDVTTALKVVRDDGYRPFLSSRVKVARALWDLGYRPSQEQINRVRKEQGRLR